MKLIAWIASGVALVLIWPFAALMTGFAYDAPTVPTYFEIIRLLLALTLLATPLVWVVALVLSIVEIRRSKRESLLMRYALAPYWAGGAHLIVWIGAFAVMD